MLNNTKRDITLEKVDENRYLFDYFEYCPSVSNKRNLKFT